MTVGEKINLLVNATDDYAEIRLKTSDQFIEMMKFMYKDKYKLIEQKEKGIALGAADYFVKTNYTPAQVLEKVKNILIEN